MRFKLYNSFYKINAFEEKSSNAIKCSESPVGEKGSLEKL